MSSIFMKSAIAHCSGGGSKKTVVYLDDLPTIDKYDEDELHLFLKFGESDLKKTEKTKEDIEKDQDVKVSCLEEVDPHLLLESTFPKSANKTGSVLVETFFSKGLNKEE